MMKSHHVMESHKISMLKNCETQLQVSICWVVLYSLVVCLYNDISIYKELSNSEHVDEIPLYAASSSYDYHSSSETIMISKILLHTLLYTHWPLGPLRSNHIIYWWKVIICRKVTMWWKVTINYKLYYCQICTPYYKRRSSRRKNEQLQGLENFFV